MKFTIPLTEEFKEAGNAIPSERVLPFLPKDKDFQGNRERLTLLSVTIRTEESIRILSVVRQVLFVLGEIPVLPLRGVMFKIIKDKAEALVFELTSFGEVGEISL